jgi:potassium large conductance calcium-activated channel subfamily M alpha protein 1
VREWSSAFLVMFSEGVEQCIPWAENTTQQIDLAFNIFFMVYFFIRVSFYIQTL